MASAEEGEWEYEYEYNENETEDFYIAIDLSNITEHCRDALPGYGHPMLAQTRLRALHASRKDIEPTVASSGAQETTSIGEIQITGLHTPNPLIKYNGQLLSCTWNSTIGTDMFFAKPTPDASASVEALRSLPLVNLLATSSAKLVAKEASLYPRDDALDKVPDETQAGEPMVISIDAQHSEDPQKLSGFLAKFNQVKANRGDRTRLAVSKNAHGSRLMAERTTQPRLAKQ